MGRLAQRDKQHIPIGMIAVAKLVCSEEYNPFSSDVSSFANFLASLFKKGLQHTSINTIRSAVSVTHI